MSEHTKGPWKPLITDMPLSEIPEYVATCISASPSNDFLFVSCTDDDGLPSDICHVGNGPRGPANAKLIAAAPELLAALEALVNCISETRGSNANAALEASLKAIAKAKGEKE